MNDLLTIVDGIGVFAFAISGIRMAAKKDFDIFGAAVVGFVTAIGGGTIRDLLLGVPVVWMQSSLYVILTLVAVGFVMCFRNHLAKLETHIFIFDTLGLALYTTVGMEKTLACGYAYWVAIIMGMMGGAAGGILRDVLLSQVPMIFRKEIYATACILGGLIYMAVDVVSGERGVAALACALTVIGSRVLAIKYGWAIPKLKGEAASEGDLTNGLEENC